MIIMFSLQLAHMVARFKLAICCQALHMSGNILIMQSRCRPYWEYFSRGVANRTPSPFQVCDGVQLQINIKNMSTGVEQFY